ncbi:type II toxin-antitoxin system TacA family antitoxin [Frigoriglobus tundricola]|uniref:DUF1778 domain-containing protein n=1 Tax=Frigoriglobus tundricola TaxID=2774151 RepID=A0A6M5YT68_9BACT|nr:DUF1778 domain-containing protein [Frigoriglobus tundricola]QJW96634.1 hypothetical protein FTUN_4191 [Frigoriglobus tundricola]
MGKTGASGAAGASPLMVRLDAASKSVLARAAELRGISVSDYVRQVTVAQARKEVEAAGSQTIAMTPAEQLAFWAALNAPVKLTAAQKKLGKLMRGGS